MHGFCAPSAKGIVGEVEADEVGEGEEGRAEGAEGLGDLGDQSAGKDVGKVGNLSRGVHTVSDRSTRREGERAGTDPEVALRFELLCDCLAGLDSEGVAPEADLLHVGKGGELVEVGLDGGCVVELELLADEAVELVRLLCWDCSVSSYGSSALLDWPTDRLPSPFFLGRV